MVLVPEVCRDGEGGEAVTLPDPACTCVRCVSLVRDRKRRAQRRLRWRGIVMCWYRTGTWIPEQRFWARHGNRARAIMYLEYDRYGQFQAT